MRRGIEQRAAARVLGVRGRRRQGSPPQRPAPRPACRSHAARGTDRRAKAPHASAALSATRARGWCSSLSLQRWSSAARSRFVSHSGSSLRTHSSETRSATASITRSWTSSTVPPASIDRDPVGGDLGDLVVGLGDRALQLQPLGLEAVLAVGAPQADLGVDPQLAGSGRARGRRSPCRPARARRWRRARGRRPGRRRWSRRSGRRRRRRPPPAPAASTRAGRSARAAEKSSSSAKRVDLQRRVGEQLADPLRGVGPPRLADRQRLRAQRLGEQLRLRALPGAVDPLQGDEQRPGLSLWPRLWPVCGARGGVGFRGFRFRPFASSPVRRPRRPRRRLLFHRRFGRFRRFALGPAFLHLLHRLAVVVEAEVPGAAAEGHDFEPRRLAADRAAVLEPEDVAALGQREGLVAGLGIVERSSRCSRRSVCPIFSRG